MDSLLIAFYQLYVNEGSNIHECAIKNGLTNTECFTLVKMGKRLSDELNTK